MATNSNDSPQDSRATSISLLKRAKEMDGEAWSRLSELYTPLVYSWCRGRGLKPDDAQDVVQEVFKAVVNDLPGFRKDEPGHSFRGWLREITRCKIADHFRRLTKGPDAIGGTGQLRLLDAVPFDVAAEDTEASKESDQSLVLTHALKLIRTDFHETTWRIFEKLVLGGRTVADVADELGKTKAAVRQAKFRVLRRLQDEFADLLD